MVKRWSHVRVLYGVRADEEEEEGGGEEEAAHEGRRAATLTVLMPFWGEDSDQSIDVP